MSESNTNPTGQRNRQDSEASTLGNVSGDRSNVATYYYQLYKIVEDTFKQLQDSGYLIPENDDNEVGVDIAHTAHMIAIAAEELLKPDEYIKVGYHFYLKTAVEALSSVGGSDE